MYATVARDGPGNATIRKLPTIRVRDTLCIGGTLSILYRFAVKTTVKHPS